jgi:N-acetyl-anhydromuramyl-L-alanine amidase AmpD
MILMPYSVSGNTLTGAQQIRPLSYGGSTIQPSHIAIHYTAGSSLSDSISHLRKVGYSYQLLIDRDGTVVQGTPLTQRAKPAVASNWHGRDNVNDFGIGISLANIGYLDRHGSWFFNMNGHGDLITKKYSKDEVVLDTHWNGHIGGNKKGWDEVLGRSICCT